MYDPFAQITPSSTDRGQGNIFWFHQILRAGNTLKYTTTTFFHVFPGSSPIILSPYVKQNRTVQ